MKDLIKQCHHNVSEDAAYKEVVVIGNGPSGIITSLLLSGWSPRLRAVPEDLPLDAMLRARLRPHEGAELMGLDLAALAEGLEGRSQNPLPLLLDNLLRPCADLGIAAEPLLEWSHDVGRQVDHVVLGKGAAGGAWHSFSPRVRTLSPGGWLALPRAELRPPAERATAGRVADYYAEYVSRMGLQKYFRSGTVVTSVTPRRHRGCESPACPLAAAWCVLGYDVATRRPLRYHCARVVLASGACDRPNTLASAERHALHDLARRDEILTRGADAILVVGSGLSAADAVCAARRAGRRVAHAYRTRAAALEDLSPHLYPDYCEVYKMMRDGLSGNHSNYIPLPDFALVEVTPLENTSEPTAKKRVKLVEINTDRVNELTVNAIFILIGSKPDLHYLPPNFDINYINIKDRVDKREVCSKCNAKHAAKRKIEEKQCFFKDRWLYIKNVVGQGIQSCKSRYWDYSSDEINGNEIDYNEKDKRDFECTCHVTNPHSNGLGFGVDPNKAIDCRTNPILIDKTTHEVLNAPKGLYALGPLVSDNFVRFISGGAVAIVAHIRHDRKLTD